MLTNLNVPYVSHNGRLYVLGNPSFDLANLLSRDVRRPMRDGFLAPHEKDAIPMIRFMLERLLGEGGMGQVFEAIHEEIGKKVAIKCLHPELSEDADAVARFQGEARAAATSGHRSIVDIHDMGTGDDEGIRRLADSLNAVAERRPDSNVRMALETTAGQGSTIGYRFEHIAETMAQVDAPERLSTCFDTCPPRHRLPHHRHLLSRGQGGNGMYPRPLRIGQNGSAAAHLPLRQCGHHHRGSLRRAGR